MMQSHRRANRHSVVLPVVFSWIEGRVTQKASGRTRDISVCGAFVQSKRCPELGTTVQFSFFLPSLLATGGSLRLQGSGRVVRMETANANSAQLGFALANTDFSLSETPDTE